MIRVLVVDDSITVRRRIMDVLALDPELEVVGEAGDGREAIERCLALEPDVVTLDMMLPVMTGLAATEYIMAYCPTPILVVSASTNRGELFRTYEALAAGAVDVLDKPSGDELADAAWEARLVATVKLVARIKVITHPRARLTQVRKQAALDSTPSGPRTIAIGVSTGGPAALVRVLGALGPDFPIPIVVVLHIGALFAPRFAEWLDDQSPLPVRYVEDGGRLPPLGRGSVWMAPPDRHLLLEHDRFRLSDDPPRHSCRPSVDVLFESVALSLGPKAVGCVLTGMGRDGALGLLAMRRAGARTIAQDEATSVVFGMPREAILVGAAEQVLPLDRIASALLLAAGRSTE
jgi:two-component system chemotaxis response regulator CheB